MPPLEGRQLGAHSINAVATVRHDPDDRDAHRRRQRVDGDAAAARRQFVGHAKRQQAGKVEPQHLAHEHDRAVQRGGVGHHDDGVGPAGAGDLTGQQVGHHLLVRADRVQAVGAGQILDRDLDAVHLGDADAAPHGDAGIVTGLGA